jgi:hypothetical protein
MTNRNDILNEFKELGSNLTVNPLENIYSVPQGYFEGFASQVLARIKAMEAADAKEELGHLSPYLSGLLKTNPYKVPAGYFEGLEERLNSVVHVTVDFKNADEELENLSPLLQGLKKENPYNVPQGYFENLSAPFVKETKVVSIASRKWFKMAAAAVLIGIVAITGVLVLNQNKVSIDKDPHAWVEKSMKKVSTENIDEFIKLAEKEISFDGTVASTTNKPDDIKELVKDIPENELQDFLKDAEALTDESEETLLN